jgi:hypothetical protein
MTGYSNYYQRVIDTYQRGIKLVLGPTGLGKSSSIPAVVYNNPDRKSIYMAHRKELLEEMAARFQAGEYVILRRDLEVVQHVLQTRRDEFENILADQRFVTYLKQAQHVTHIKNLDVATIHRACQQISEWADANKILPSWVTEYADRQARIVLLAFRSVLKLTGDASGRGRVYNWLTSHPVVEAFFPAIPFRLRPGVRIMLVTLQKAYYGFFDGTQMRSLTDLSDEEGLLIFLDEFDFLEHELTKQICRAPQITDPFDFTANFYRAMEYHKLPKADFPLHPNIRQRIEKIVEIIKGVQQRGLNYPDVNQFTLEKVHIQGSLRSTTPAIFRTQHIISTNPLHIKQTTRSFQLEMQYPGPPSVPAAWFFNAIGTATTRIIALFKELERDDEVRYWEMMRQCFRNTDFFDQIIAIPRLPRQSLPQTTSRGSLLDISDLQQRTDNEEVEVQFCQMLQTPENLLHTLAEKYLIFGLSATADLPRSVHHFDLDWLERQNLLLPTTEQDCTDIQEMSAEKAMKRGGSSMSVVQVDGLNTADTFQNQLHQFLSAVTKSDEFGEDTAGKHRSQRMHRFFAALLWGLEHGNEDDRQLLFLNTFRQVKLLFTSFAADARDVGLYTIEAFRATPWFAAFTITIIGKKAIVVFFNAELATQIRQSKEAEQDFTQLFWHPYPVTVVTQYLSAGNGVNLQYTNRADGPLQDFTHIGLLEAPYYFFTKPDPQEQAFDEVFAAHKENIWYQAKLFFSKQISLARFHQVLRTVDRPSEWNQRYQQGSTATDCLFNQLAVFIQALGRVERAWDRTPAQVALLSPEVFRIFQAFIGNEYETIRERRAPFTSANLQAVLEHVALQTRSFEREARRRRDARLRASNDRCRDAMRELVTRLETVREHEQDLAAREDWEQLRQAVLQHDFHAHVVERYFCATSSPYYSYGKMCVTAELDILPPGVIVPDGRLIDMDAVYTVIASNPVIHDHFLDQGYDLQFDHPGFHFFTPYCLQAILAGAIGEEAITALLTREGVKVEPLPNALFEITDLRVVSKPWFIDCKNYNDQTLDRFALPIDDPLWHPSLNEAHFMQHAQTKLDRIVRHEGADSKLIYLNLVSGQERPLGYYDRDFHAVSDFNAATMIVVQGALDRQAPGCFQSAFSTFLADIKRALKPLKEDTEV